MPGVMCMSNINVGGHLYKMDLLPLCLVHPHQYPIHFLYFRANSVPEAECTVPEGNDNYSARSAAGPLN